MNPVPPQDELARLRKLSEFDVDFSEARESLHNLTTLAAKIAGTPISLINLIDAFTQWSITSYGMELEQMAREDSVCQYTIQSKESFEVKDLSRDDRFSDKEYVTGGPQARYYFGVPLQTHDGYNIGALCVLDRVGKEISPAKVEQLKIVADEIVGRIASFQTLQQLKTAVKEARDTQRKVAHDIRGPLGGIVNLSQLITSQGEENKITDVLAFVDMIQRTGLSLLDLADEILNGPRKEMLAEGVQYSPFNMQLLKEKLEKLYTIQASPKNIAFDVSIVNGNETLPIKKEKLLQIAGNLVSNAIKFTPSGGAVHVELEVKNTPEDKKLFIRVKDSGTGMDQQVIDNIQKGAVVSRNGTAGELGYGLGLALVKELVDSLQGSMHIASSKGNGTFFELAIPQ